MGAVRKRYNEGDGGVADTSVDRLDDAPASEGRRNFLFLATGAVGAVTVGAIAWPFVHQMNPDASVQALASVSIDLSPIEEGQEISVMWRGKPVFVRHLTDAEIVEAREVDISTLRDPQSFDERLPGGGGGVAPVGGFEKWLIQIGVCTHLGCIPIAYEGDYDGWFCPCHGSHYDTAGRIRRGPATSNLAIPDPIVFESDTSVVVG